MTTKMAGDRKKLFQRVLSFPFLVRCGRTTSSRSGGAPQQVDPQRSSAPLAAERQPVRRTQRDRRDGKRMADDPRLLGLLNRLLDVQALTEVLTADVVESAHAVDSRRSGTKRAYVRTVFALIEGALSGMSTFLLEGDSSYGWELSVDEQRVLWDAVPDSSVERPSGGPGYFDSTTKAARQEWSARLWRPLRSGFRRKRLPGV